MDEGLPLTPVKPTILMPLAEDTSTKRGVTVANLMGRVCMAPLECSLPATEVLLKQLK